MHERILAAAVQVFYEKDFRSAKMQDIAKLADVSASLLYSYFENKEKLFEGIVSSTPFDFDRIAREEESILADTSSERFRVAAEACTISLRKKSPRARSYSPWARRRRGWTNIGQDLYAYLATSTASKIRVLDAVFEKIGLRGDDPYFKIRPEADEE